MEQPFPMHQPLSERSASSRQAGPEGTFARLLLAFGILYAVALPPGQAPDETDHFVHAYHVSEGNLHPVMVGAWGGGEIPESVQKLTHDFDYLPFHALQQARPESYYNAVAAPLEPNRRHAVPFVSCCYSLVPYLPQAAGIAVARCFGAGPLVLSYAGRLANLCVAAVVVYFAIRTTPVFKNVFGMVALLPISVQQFASNSPDASTIAAAFWFVAAVLKLSVGPRLPEKRACAAGLVPLIAWLTLCKFPYGALALCFLGIPASRLGGRWKYVGAGLVLGAMTLSLALLMAHLRTYAPDTLLPRSEEPTSIRKQLRYVRSHPGHYVVVCATTVALYGKEWFEQMGTLGWLDTSVNGGVMQAFIVLLAIVALGDRREGFAVTLRARVAAALAAAAGVFLVFTANYVAGDPIRAPFIHGISGRYFLPLLPVLLLPLNNETFRLNVAPKVLGAVAMSAGAAVQLAAVLALVRRYHFTPDVEPITATAAVAAGAFMMTVCVSWAIYQEARGRHCSLS